MTSRFDGKEYGDPTNLDYFLKEHPLISIIFLLCVFLLVGVSIHLLVYGSVVG